MPKVKIGKGKTEFGPGVEVILTGDEVAVAIDAFLVAHGIYVSGPRTIRVNSELCESGSVYVDPSGFLIADGKKYSGRDSLAQKGEESGEGMSSIHDELWSRQTALYKGKPHGFVQWQGTTVCMDLWCEECKSSTHFCGQGFTFAVSCAACGRAYFVNPHVEMVLMTKEEEAHWQAGSGASWESIRKGTLSVKGNPDEHDRIEPTGDRIVY